MRKFINIIKSYVRRLKNSDYHQKKLVLFSFVTVALFHLLGSGILFSILCALVMGTIAELAHCFMPKKSVKVLKWLISVPDYKTFIANIKIGSITTYNEMDDDNVFFSVIGIVTYLLIRLIILFF